MLFVDFVYINFFYIGYELVEYVFFFKQDIVLNIDLDGVVQLEEVVVWAFCQGECIEECSQMS